MKELQNKIIKLFDLPREIIKDQERQRRVYSIIRIMRNKIKYAESIEEKPVDRYYNKHNKYRKTHYEILGGGIAYYVRKGVCGHVIIYG